ncbi:MAG TPA: acyltransferase [Stellaceae bacterium]|nr:acyltransferase [Stellaceae bacterium]
MAWCGVELIGKNAARADRRSKISSIEMLRGLAAVAVAWFHLTNQYPWGLTRYSGAYGWLGVQAFFVISGFVIPYSMFQQGYKLRGFFQFLVRRIIRLEPPYLVSIALIIILWELSSRAPGFEGVAPHFTLLQILLHLFYLVPLGASEWLSPVYWTLAYEFVFYSLMGLSYAFLIKRHIFYTAIGAIFACTISTLIFDVPDTNFLLFLIGTAGMRYFTKTDDLQMTALAVGFSAIVVALISSSGAGLIAVCSLLVIMYVPVAQTNLLLFFGRISYSLYLVHVPIGGRVVNLGMKFGSGAVYDFALSCLALALSISFAWLFFMAIERPALIWSKRLVPKTMGSSK